MANFSKVGSRNVANGKSYERLVAKKLSANLGMNFRRTICSGGQYEPGDLKRTDGPWNLEIECKSGAGYTLLQIMKGTSNLNRTVSPGRIVIFRDTPNIHFVCIHGADADKVFFEEYGDAFPYIMSTIYGQAYYMFMLDDLKIEYFSKEAIYGR